MQKVQLDAIDVLCVGFACYDLVFAVDHHPGPDEKVKAGAFFSCGGGTAANAAIAAAQMGARTALVSYLGSDIYGDQHLAELQAAGGESQLVARGPGATPISAIFVKPDGSRSIVNHREAAGELAPDAVPFGWVRPRAVLLDGHQATLALAVVAWAHAQGIPTVLDADTVNQGNQELVERCTLVAASERFALEFTGAATPEAGLAQLARLAPAVVVTLGERGLIWQRGDERGALPAYTVDAVDTTGAGDTFHGALAAGLAQGLGWEELLRFASAAGALCCTRHGARLGIPTRAEVLALAAL
ncbi:MAG: carbohydrate kinase family protein [Caldilinea sp.]